MTDQNPFAELERLSGAVEAARNAVKDVIAERDKEIRRLRKTGLYRDGMIQQHGGVKSRSQYATIVKDD